LASAAAAEPAASAAKASEVEPRPAQAAQAARERAGGNGADRLFASPLARRMAKQASVDLTRVKGTGPHGRIVKADIERMLTEGDRPAPAARLPGATPAGGGAQPTFEDQPLSSVRKVIASRLTAAHQQVPVFYLTVDCEIDRLMAAREEINAHAPKSGQAGEAAYKISLNDLVIKAAALALRSVPAVNALWNGDSIRVLRSIDIAVAVAYEGGLITPIIWNADAKGLATIALEMKELAARARAGKLKPEEYQGGGFSVSNLGMYGIRQFTSIINPPQACILAVGAGEQRVVVRDGKIETATLMTVTLTCDHRVVDGALGARWLQSFRRFIESPATMLA
jgi:pyruvate dehydrogenase E2 component (dihydrolipoamide acetyltransferase)